MSEARHLLDAILELHDEVRAEVVSATARHAMSRSVMTPTSFRPLMLSTMGISPQSCCTIIRATSRSDVSGPRFGATAVSTHALRF